MYIPNYITKQKWEEKRYRKWYVLQVGSEVSFHGFDLFIGYSVKEACLIVETLHYFWYEMNPISLQPFFNVTSRNRFFGHRSFITGALSVRVYLNGYTTWASGSTSLTSWVGQAIDWRRDVTDTMGIDSSFDPVSANWTIMLRYKQGIDSENTIKANRTINFTNEGEFSDLIRREEEKMTCWTF